MSHPQPDAFAVPLGPRRVLVCPEIQTEGFDFSEDQGPVCWLTFAPRLKMTEPETNLTSYPKVVCLQHQRFQ